MLNPAAVDPALTSLMGTVTAYVTENGLAIAAVMIPLGILFGFVKKIGRRGKSIG